ncbi:MAG TPA: ABC transporter ATP-binding protein [Phycisphaerales bacterium]|nr:ABC transporter ATP-binding protein [Phycisphaerales bacterium]
MSGAVPLLAADRVYKTYRLGRVDVPVLRGASLEVHEGQWVAVLGSSGSGKSTLLHLLGGLDRPDGPERACRAPASGVPVAPAANPGQGVVFRGEPLGTWSETRLDRYRSVSVGFVFQFYHLLPELDVVENVALGAMIRHGRLGYRRRRRELRGRATGLLESFGLGHRLRHRPAELSGGERQRVAIARALINDPAVLLADEPTGNLDRATGGTILDALATHHSASRRTMVLVTHDPEVAARADRVVRLEDGCVVAG